MTGTPVAVPPAASFRRGGLRVIAPGPRATASIDAADPVWRAALEQVRTLCREELGGYVEEFRSGMSMYARTADAEVGIAAARKRHLSLYNTRTDVMAAFRDALAGCDLGKGCIRYRRTDDIDADLVREIVHALAGARWISSRGPGQVDLLNPGSSSHRNSGRGMNTRRAPPLRSRAGEHDGRAPGARPSAGSTDQASAVRRRISIFQLPFCTTLSS